MKEFYQSAVCSTKDVKKAYKQMHIIETKWNEFSSWNNLEQKKSIWKFTGEVNYFHLQDKRQGMLKK